MRKEKTVKETIYTHFTKMEFFQAALSLAAKANKLPETDESGLAALFLARELDRLRNARINHERALAHARSPKCQGR